jgi:hypothetical protein
LLLAWKRLDEKHGNDFCLQQPQRLTTLIPRYNRFIEEKICNINHLNHLMSVGSIDESNDRFFEAQQS